MIKAIFWDNDGVLVDTEKLYFLANKIIFETVGIDLTAALYVENFLIQGSGAWHLLSEKDFSSEQLANLREKRDTLYSEFLCKEKLLLNGVEEVLKCLHGKYKMGVVTSSRNDHFKLIHQSTNILNYFDFILTGEDFTRFKPDPQPYLMALERTGLKKEECIIIEDSERGLASANAAGINCIVIPHELTKHGNFNSAFKILNKIDEIIPVIENFKQGNL